MNKLLCSIISVVFIFYVGEALAQQITPEEIFQRVSPSVVTVFTQRDEKNIAQGSGVILNDSGWVVTNFHVFEGGDKLVLSHGDQLENNTTIIGADKEKDILILRIPKNSPLMPGDAMIIKIGNFDSLRIGQKMYTIGSPLGLENTLSEGVISGLRVNRGDEEGESYFIQSTAPISPGSSGGAVLNKYGELIGISTQTLRGGQSLNFAIPVKEIFQVLIEEYTDGKLEVLILRYKFLSEAPVTSENDAQWMEMLKKQIENRPDDSNHYWNLARTYVRLKKFKTIVKLLNSAMELGLKQGILLYLLAESYFYLEKNELSMQYFLMIPEMNAKQMFGVVAEDDYGINWQKEQAAYLKAGTYYFLSLLYAEQIYNDRAKNYRQKAFALKPSWKEKDNLEILRIIEYSN